MKIVFIAQFFSEGMGYTENILPKYLAKLGHEVIVISSDLQVYGNSDDYMKNYSSFLGEAKCSLGIHQQEGFILHRLKHYSIGRYIGLKGLRDLLDSYQPDIIQFIQITGIDHFITLIYSFSLSCPVFTECHQHSSIIKEIPLKIGFLTYLKSKWYNWTRTVPSRIAHKRVEKCFAIAPDCEVVANTLYGVPNNKIVPLPLGTDTDFFHPCKSIYDQEQRDRLRSSLNVQHDDIVVIYTGRFSSSKNPLILAKAIESIRVQGIALIGVFVGSGEQKDAITACIGCKALDFQRYTELALLYRAVDIAVWPREESMSMLDAASSGLPLIVSNKMGDQNRIIGNGLTYEDGNVNSLINSLSKLIDKNKRVKMASTGRRKMLKSYSWLGHAETRVRYYEAVLSKKLLF